MEQYTFTIEDRKSIFDIFCESESGERFIIEMQKNKKLQNRIFEKLFKIVETARYTHDEWIAYQLSLKEYRDSKAILKTAEEEGRKKRTQTSGSKNHKAKRKASGKRQYASNYGTAAS